MTEPARPWSTPKAQTRATGRLRSHSIAWVRSIRRSTLGKRTRRTERADSTARSEGSAGTRMRRRRSGQPGEARAGRRARAAAARARAVPGRAERGRAEPWVAAAVPGALRAAAAGHGEQGAAAAPADRHQPQEDEAAHGARLRRLRRM